MQHGLREKFESKKINPKKYTSFCTKKKKPRFCNLELKKKKVNNIICFSFFVFVIWVKKKKKKKYEKKFKFTDIFHAASKKKRQNKY